MEVKIIDVCLRVPGNSNTTQFSSDAYIIQQAVVNHTLFFILNILSFIGFFLWIIYKIARYCSGSDKKNQSTSQQNMTQEFNLPQYPHNSGFSIENTTEKNLLIRIFMKVSVIEEKLLKNENNSKKENILNDENEHKLRFHCFARFLNVVSLG